MREAEICHYYLYIYIYMFLSLFFFFFQTNFVVKSNEI